MHDDDKQQGLAVVSIDERGEIVFLDGGYMLRLDCLIARPRMGLAFIRNWKALQSKLYKVVRL